MSVDVCDVVSDDVCDGSVFESYAVESCESLWLDNCVEEDCETSCQHADDIMCNDCALETGTFTLRCGECGPSLSGPNMEAYAYKSKFFMCDDCSGTLTIYHGDLVTCGGYKYSDDSQLIINTYNVKKIECEGTCTAPVIRCHVTTVVTESCDKSLITRHYDLGGFCTNMGFPGWTAGPQPSMQTQQSTLVPTLVPTQLSTEVLAQKLSAAWTTEELPTLPVTSEEKSGSNVLI